MILRRPRWLRADRPPAPGGYSLRRRMLVTVLGTSAALWLVSLALVVGVAWRESSEMFDEALEESARLALVLGTELSGPGVPARTARDADGDPVKLKLYYQLVSQGKVLRRAEDAPAEPFVRDSARAGGHANVRIDGRFWRVHVRADPTTGLQAQVGQPWEERLELLEEMAEKLVWPALGLLLLLAALCWFAIRRLLAPLEQMAAGIAARSPQDLSPVALRTPPPRELQPVVEALDALLARLHAALQAERRFTADAAHELRTPLAALRMRAQLIERQIAAATPATVPMLRLLREDVDRCTALVESLLALARLDPGDGALPRETVDLDTLFAGLDASAARARGLTLHLQANGLRLQAHPTLLASALRNLLDNAARHGHAGGIVHLEADTLPNGRLRIRVRDNGAGVPPAERQRLGERFFRVLGSGEGGSGLGLSIVARIAALHGAALRFEDGLEGRGLGVVLEFPPG